MPLDAAAVAQSIRFLLQHYGLRFLKVYTMPPQLACRACCVAAPETDSPFPHLPDCKLALALRVLADAEALVAATDGVGREV